jgi:hypothetical protein
VVQPEADKSWGKGEGEVHNEFESYGFFYNIADPTKVLIFDLGSFELLHGLTLSHITAHTILLVRSRQHERNYQSEAQ